MRVVNLAYFCAGNVVLLIAVRFIHGATFGIISTSSETIIADIVPEKRRGEGIGYYSLSQTIATAIGPFLGMWFNWSGNYNMIFAACTVVAAACVLTAPFLSLSLSEEIGTYRGTDKGNEGGQAEQFYRIQSRSDFNHSPVDLRLLFEYCVLHCSLCQRDRPC
jgi:MFS family permease